MKTPIRLFLAALLLSVPLTTLLAVMPSAEQMQLYTADWKGSRTADGRPQVSDELLQRVKAISIEEAWGVLRAEGFHNQFEGDWVRLHDDQTFVGRALTAHYQPLRPDVNARVLAQGKADGRVGPSNSWPIDQLQRGDVYVADGYGKIINGTLIGDNLGNAIFARSGTGVVFDAGVRDPEGLREIEGFNAFVRGFDPSYLMETMLTGINVPVRIGRAIVFPGDVVLAKKSGVIFIPPHLVEKVVIQSEFIKLRDQFGHQRLREGRYTPGQIDTQWTDAIKSDFLQWLDANPQLLPMTRAELDAYMKSRTW
jgi:4-hydroxy-4-methyl-2-oxoglutarate aldolase